MPIGAPSRIFGSTANGMGNLFYRMQADGRMREDQKFRFHWSDDPRKAALAAVVAAYGIDRKAAYDALVAAKKASTAAAGVTQGNALPPRP